MSAEPRLPGETSRHLWLNAITSASGGLYRWLRWLAMAALLVGALLLVLNQSQTIKGLPFPPFETEGQLYVDSPEVYTGNAWSTIATTRTIGWDGNSGRWIRVRTC